MPSINALVTLAAISAASLVSAHGFIQAVVADGQTYEGVNDPVRLHL